MGYWLNGGMIGIIIILVLSMAMTPVLCNTFQQRYTQVSCQLEDNIQTFSNIYLQGYFILLLIAAFIAGGLVARLFYMTKHRFDITTKAITEKAYGKPRFKWMWEDGKQSRFEN